MLTLKKAFAKVNRDITEGGKGSYWIVTGLSGDTRDRQRRKNASARHSDDGDEGNDDYPSEGPSSTMQRPGRVIRSPYSPHGLNIDTRSRNSPSPYPSDESSGAPSPTGSSGPNLPPARVMGRQGAYRRGPCISNPLLY